MTFKGESDDMGKVVPGTVTMGKQSHCPSPSTAHPSAAPWFTHLFWKPKCQGLDALGQPNEKYSGNWRDCSYSMTPSSWKNQTCGCSWSPPLMVHTTQAHCLAFCAVWYSWPTCMCSSSNDPPDWVLGRLNVSTFFKSDKVPYKHRLFVSFYCH